MKKLFCEIRYPFSFKCIKLFMYFLVMLTFAWSELNAVYIERFTTNDNGGILFTGNTLGLSKQINQNQPGTSDAAGAFITTNMASQVGMYLPGTTLTWQNNSSFAYLDLPTSSTVLYAELIWSGSYGFNNQITGNEPNTPITITTPLNTSFIVAPDPATSQKALTPGFTDSGNYVRSANVTSIVQAGGAGQYTVGGIAATISALDNTHNAAGWTLGVVFHNGSMLTYNMTIFVGCEQASSNTNQPAAVSGFCVPPSGVKTGNLFISAIEGDASKTGDHMLFGNTPTLTIAANSQSGGNNPINNFFASQMNTLLPLTSTAVFTKLLWAGSGELDTRGSFGNFNSDPFTGTIFSGDRQGYDITSIDVSSTLAYNEMTAYALGTTTADDYTINALGLQIQVGAPIITQTKRVNNQVSIVSNVGQTVTFDFVFQNIGTSDATSVVFTDILESGLTFVPGSFLFNGTPQPDPNLMTGFAMGGLIIGQTSTVQFQALITSYPPSDNIFVNVGDINYQFQTCLGTTLNLNGASNEVFIELPSLNVPNIQAQKTVNSVTAISSSVGSTVNFMINLQNTGTGDAMNVIFMDVLPAGLTLVPGTVLLNDVIVTPEPNLTTGFPIGELLVGQTAMVEFKATIDSFPATGAIYTNMATIDYQYMPLPNIFVNLTTDTNLVSISLAPSPITFVGSLKKCKALDRTYYNLKATFTPSASPNVLFYRIYHNGKIVAKINSTGPFEYKTTLKSKEAAQGFAIAAVFSGNIESVHTPLIFIKNIRYAKCVPYF